VSPLSCSLGDARWTTPLLLVLVLVLALVLAVGWCGASRA
jgi:hypothetical protein